MAMSENEAIERLKCMRLFMEINDRQNENKFLEDDYVANSMAIQALEEIQKYRAIGTVEELKTAMKYVSLAKKHGTVGKAIDACAEYESIGTIEDFKALKEKSVAKKPIDRVTCKDGIIAVGDVGICPNCGHIVAEDMLVCEDCFQVLDWFE